MLQFAGTFIYLVTLFLSVHSFSISISGPPNVVAPASATVSWIRANGDPGNITMRVVDLSGGNNGKIFQQQDADGEQGTFEVNIDPSVYSPGNVISIEAVAPTNPKTNVLERISLSNTVTVKSASTSTSTTSAITSASIKTGRLLPSAIAGTSTTGTSVSSQPSATRSNSAGPPSSSDNPSYSYMPMDTLNTSNDHRNTILGAILGTILPLTMLVLLFVFLRGRRQRVSGTSTGNSIYPFRGTGPVDRDLEAAQNDNVLNPNPGFLRVAVEPFGSDPHPSPARIISAALTSPLSRSTSMYTSTGPTTGHYEGVYVARDWKADEAAKERSQLGDGSTVPSLPLPAYRDRDVPRGENGGVVENTSSNEARFGGLLAYDRSRSSVGLSEFSIGSDAPPEYSI